MVDTTVTKASNYKHEMTASAMEQHSNGVDLDTIADSDVNTISTLIRQLVLKALYIYLLDTTYSADQAYRV